MKAAYLGLALGLLLGVAVLFYTGIDSPKRVAETPSPDVQEQPTEKSKLGGSLIGASSPTSPASAPAITSLNSSSLLADKESADEIISRLQEASFTYDAAALKDIQPHLVSSDPAVRQAALDAVVTLGDPAGAKVLREAAGKTRNAAEAAELRAKADYLELPPASLLSPEKIRALRAAHQAQPTKARPSLPAGVSRGSSLEGRANGAPSQNGSD
jgi:hypothetical protein